MSGGTVGSPTWVRICWMEERSVVKAIRPILPLQLGHTSGKTS